MPIFKINTLKLDQEKKDLMAEKLFESAKKMYGIGNITIYFNEFDSVYIMGKPVSGENDRMLVEVQGPLLGTEKRAEFCKEINDIVQDVMKNTGFKICFFADRGSPDEYGGVNGMLFSEFHKKKE